VRSLIAALLAALFAVAPLAAQKPGADGALDPVRERWRGQGISHCVAEIGTDPAEGIGANALETICGCAFERYLAGRATASLPPIDVPGRGRTLLARELMSCTAERQPELAALVARRIAQAARDSAQAAAQAAIAAPPVAEAPVAEAPPPAPPGAVDKPTGAAAPAGAAPGAWLDGLTLPRWLTNSGVPLWAWVPLIALLLVLLLSLFRRGRDRRDIIGPPPAMRRDRPRRP
jgi:hypothetical protein